MASIIARIDLGLASNPMRVLICLTAPGIRPGRSASGRRTSDQRAAGGAPRCVHAAPAQLVRRARPVASRHDLWPRRTALCADPTTGPAFRRPSCKPHRCDGRSNPKQRRANAGSNTPI